MPFRQYMITEIQLITTIIYQHLSNNISRHHHQHPSNLFFQSLLKDFEQLRISISLNDRLYIFLLKCKDLIYSSSLNTEHLCRYECILPFCSVIAENETPSSITAVSIDCITNLLTSHCFINKNALNAMECIQCIGNAITSVTLDVKQNEFDQGLLLKFMNLINALLDNECFVFLTEANIWNLFEKCLCILFNANMIKHSEAIFEFAEIVICNLTKKIFGQLPHLLNAQSVPSSNQKQHKKSNKVNRAKRGYTSLKEKILSNSKKEQTTKTKAFKASKSFDIDCLIRILSALLSANPQSYEGGELNESPQHIPIDSNRLMLCLKLIMIALNESGSHFHKHPRILTLIEDNLCFLLLRHGKNTQFLMLYELILRIYAELMHHETLRHRIKLQNELLFEMLFVRILKSGLPNPSQCQSQNNESTERKTANGDEEKYENSLPTVETMSLPTNIDENEAHSEQSVDAIFVKTMLNHLLDLCLTDYFIAELFENYDCSMYSSNLCSDLVIYLSKCIIPGRGIFDDIHYLATMCLMNIAQINANCVIDNAINASTNIQKKKAILFAGIDIFNYAPSKGITYWFDHGLLQNDDSNAADAIVDILFFCERRFNAEHIGYYLGSDDLLASKVRHKYIARRYCFDGLTLDAAMRGFFEDFKLPIETQQVDRILESFSTTYCAQNTTTWHMSASTTYTLTFALMVCICTQL